MAIVEESEIKKRRLPHTSGILTLDHQSEIESSQSGTNTSLCDLIKMIKSLDELIKMERIGSLDHENAKEINTFFQKTIKKVSLPLPTFHYIIAGMDSTAEGKFSMFLKHALKHYPHEMELLF